MTFFSKIGIDAAGSVDEPRRAHRALSSLNAPTVFRGRILRSMAISGGFTAPMSKTGVPYGGNPAHRISLLGIILNAIKPSQTFEIITPHRAATGVIAAWAMIVACQLQLHRMANAEQLQRPEIPDFTVQRLSDAGFLAGVLIPDASTTRSLDDRRNGDRYCQPHRCGIWSQSCDGLAHRAIDHTKSVAVVHHSAGSNLRLRRHRDH